MAVFYATGGSGYFSCPSLPIFHLNASNTSSDPLFNLHNPPLNQVFIIILPTLNPQPLQPSYIGHMKLLDAPQVCILLQKQKTTQTTTQTKKQGQLNNNNKDELRCHCPSFFTSPPHLNFVFLSSQQFKIQITSEHITTN
jgi:hypothetical protein